MDIGAATMVCSINVGICVVRSDSGSESRVRLHQTSRGGKAVEDFAGEFGEEGG